LVWKYLGKCLLGSLSRWEIDGNISGSCPMAGFGFSGAETLGSVTTVLVILY
jgi:hypothetical protein